MQGLEKGEASLMREAMLKGFQDNILVYRNRAGWIPIPGIISS